MELEGAEGRRQLFGGAAGAPRVASGLSCVSREPGGRAVRRGCGAAQGQRAAARGAEAVGDLVGHDDGEVVARGQVAQLHAQAHELGGARAHVRGALGLAAAARSNSAR